MPQMINTNIASLTAQRNLNASQSSLHTSLERLSSGLRINSAKDDAAGLAISERMTSQIRGLNQAVRNANDGVSLAQTAEGAMSEVGNNLQRIRELAVQSSNATNSASDRKALQAEVSQLTAEITRVASQTQFNGINLLDGSFQSQSFQVGANSGQTIDISGIMDARATGMGSNTLTTDGTAVGTSTAATAGAPANTGVTAETDLTLTTDKGSTTVSYAIDSSAEDIATAINNAGDGIGITATATNSATLGNFGEAGDVTMNLNGTAISATVSDVSDLSTLADAINGAQGTTGITASFADPNDKSTLTLTAANGSNIALDTFTTTAATTQTVDFAGMDGTTRTLTNGGTDSSTATGTVEFSSDAGQLNITNGNGDVISTTASTFNSVATLDISSSAGAQQALETIDAALGQLNSTRGDLGAIQNRFSSTISNLQTTSENLSASRSRIQDADFAAETANMTRGQILQQAGTAMLAQANSLPNNVLSLLR